MLDMDNLFELLVKLGIPLFFILRWLYKLNRGRLEMKLAGMAIMNDNFSQALLILSRIGEREMEEIKAGALNLEPAVMRQKLERLRLFALGIEGCLEKMGARYPSDSLVASIGLQLQLVSQRRLVKKAGKSKQQRQQWRDITDQHQQNIKLVEQLWRQLQKNLQVGKGAS